MTNLNSQKRNRRLYRQYLMRKYIEHGYNMTSTLLWFHHHMNHIQHVHPDISSALHELDIESKNDIIGDVIAEHQDFERRFSTMVERFAEEEGVDEQRILDIIKYFISRNKRGYIRK